ncbi:hypothetical protein WJX79_006133 [Trebouxia sp. C0005]
MSNILKAMATARESAFFKQEQEADLQRYRTHLISMGKIENAAGANLKPRRHKTFEESIKAFEVLPEVLQQQARLDDPGAAARREIIRRIRGMPSKLSEAELSKYRSTIYGLSAHVGHVPKMHLGRNKWHMAAGFSESAPAAIPLSPEAVETARRAYSAGVRSMLYGSMLGLLGAAVLGTLAARYMGLSSLQDLRPSTDPEGSILRKWLQPYKERIQAYTRPAVAVSPADASNTTRVLPGFTLKPGGVQRKSFEETKASLVTKQRLNLEYPSLQDFELLQTLGTGTFGRVRLVRSRSTGTYLALKAVKKAKVLERKHVAHIVNEKAVLSQVHHPFIISLKSTFQDSQKLYLLLEYVPGGELFKHLRSAGKFSLGQARFYAASIFLVFEKLHQQDYVYR